MTKINIQVTPDELANLMTAVEHYQDYLDDFGEKDYDPEDDLVELKESVSRAYQALNRAGEEFFSRPRRR